MPKYRVKEFAEAYGIKESTIKSYVHRKQLQKDAEGLIDTDSDVNKLFLLEMNLKLNTGGISKSKRVVKVPESNTPTGLTQNQQVYADIDLRTRIATAERAEREAELKRIQLEKMAGNLLPVDIVHSIFVINTQSIFKNFEVELENLASIYITDRELLASTVEKQKQILSKSIEKAKEDAFYEIENAINEYQEIRGRGERK